MRKQPEKYYYNFNTREGLKNMQLRTLIQMCVMHRAQVPIGTIKVNRKYETPCRNSYMDYNLCLQRNRFDRKICEQYEKAVIHCQKEKGLYPDPEQVIAKLKLGLKISKKRRQEIMKALKQRHEGKKVKIPGQRYIPKLDEDELLDIPIAQNILKQQQKKEQNRDD